MAHTRKTLKLSQPDWDLMVDGYGKIAVSVGGYSTAQNVANECRLFTNDACFDQTRGIPYFMITLGKTPALSVLKSRLRKAALLVEDVKDVTKIEIQTFDTTTRQLTGDIQFISHEGENGSVEL